MRHPHLLSDSSLHSNSARVLGRAALVLTVALAHSACTTIPSTQVDTGADIAAAAGLATPVEFRVVGDDGGEVDELGDEPAVLSLAGSIRRALDTDPGLQAALARVAIARADADQARLLPNPVLSVVLRLGSGEPQVEASFAEEFVGALQRPGRVQAADHRLRAVSADAVGAALDVIADVQASYVDAQSAGARLPILAERLALVERLVSTAHDRLEAGEGTRADVVTLDAQRVELEVAMDRVRLEERTDRLHLARRIGRPSAQADWSLDAWRTPALPERSEDEWVDAALVSRPEIAALVWLLRALGDEQGLARLAPWEGATAGLEIEHDDDLRIGPGLSTPLPLFDDGGARRARLAADIAEARHGLTQAKRRVVEEVRIAHRSILASRTNLERVQRDLLPLLRQRRELAEDSYRAGQTDVTPLYLAEQDLRIAELEAVEVEAQAVHAFVRLQRAVGGPGVAAHLAGTAPASPTRLADRFRTALARPADPLRVSALPEPTSVTIPSDTSKR